MFKSISQPCLPYFIFLTIINGLEDKLPFLLNKFDGGGFRAADILEAAGRLGAVNSVLTGTHSKLLTDRTQAKWGLVENSPPTGCATVTP